MDTLLEMLKDIVLITEEGKIIKYNSVALKEYRYSPEEFEGMQIAQLYLYNDLSNIIRNHTETFHKRNDGTILLVDITCQSDIYEGKDVLIYLIRDITSQKAVEKKIIENEESLRTIFERAPLGIGVYDEDGYIVRCNRMLESIVGYSGEELHNMSFKDYTHPEDLYIGAGQLSSLHERKIDNYTMEKRYIHKSGSILWVNVSVSLLNTHKDEILKIVIIENITNRKRAEKELQKAQRKAILAHRLAAVGTMATGIAHEINQPLNSIRVAVDWLLYLYTNNNVSQKGEDIDEIIDTLSDISSEINAISEIIKNMQLFVSNKYQEVLKPCDLNFVIENVIRQNEECIKKGNIKIARNTEGNLLINGNTRKLMDIINNLLINALDALKPMSLSKKIIEINSFSKGQFVIVEVKDNATGIPECDKDRLFDPFFTTKDVGEGMGIGLTLVNSFVQSLQGQIDVYNNKEGGATFRIKFPSYISDTVQPVKVKKGEVL